MSVRIKEPMSCLTRLLPLLFLVLAVASCWAFAVQTDCNGARPDSRVPASAAANQRGTTPAGAACTDVCSAGAALYGDAPRAAPSSFAAPGGLGTRLTALNLAEQIYARERVLGTTLEAAADLLGPPVLPVTGLDDVDNAIELTLEEQFMAHEDTEPSEPREQTGPLLRRTEFQKVANAVSQQSVAAAQPKPPKLEPLDDMLPSRVWSPVFEGCSSKFVESRCNFQKPAPQLFVTNLNELMSARSLLMGQAQLIEPLTARQTLAQLLTMGWRSKKDPYSRASMTNDVAFGTCKAMAEATPEFVVF